MTGEDGAVELGLPVRNAATVTVSAMGAESSTRLDWLFLNLLAVVLLGAVAAVVAVGSVVERGVVGRAARAIRRVARRIGQATLNALFALAGRIDDLVAWLPELPGILRGFAERLVAAPARTLRDLATRTIGWLTAVAVGVVAWLRGLLDDDAIRGLGADDDEHDAGAAASDGEEGGEDEGRTLSLAEAWRVLVSLVSPSRLRTRTPAEIGRMALDMGFPSDAVETLTEAYQRAVYGGEDPSDEDVERASSAAQSLERAADGDGGDDGSDAMRADGGDSAARRNDPETDRRGGDGA